MRRKVIQIAESTQLVSLPRKWALKYGIKKGDELEITEQGNKIIVSSEKTSQVKAVDIDVTGLDRTSILYNIEILYRLGYEEIRVTFASAKADHYRRKTKENIISLVHYVATRLIGMEVIQQRENFALLKSLERVSPKEFDTVVGRIFILLKDAADDFLIANQKKDTELLESLQEKHDSIAKFISYGMRILNRAGTGDNRNTHLLFHILNQLDKLTDIIKYASRDIRTSKQWPGKPTLKIIEGVNTSITLYTEFFQSFKKEKMQQLYFNRHSVIEDIDKHVTKMKPWEIRITEYYRHILEFLTDITQARLGLEF